MILLTVLSLIYINMQMQIFDLAYKGKKKEKEIRTLLDNNGTIVYNILTLKSANNLGVKWLTEDSKMQFLDTGSVVKLEARVPLKAAPILRQREEKKNNLLLSLFSLKSQAEARE